MDIGKEDPIDQATLIGKNFSDEVNESLDSDELKRKALIEAVFWTHRANPGSTSWIVRTVEAAKEYVENDRKFIVEHKLDGWESYE